MPLERIDSYFNGAVESYDERLKRSAEVRSVSAR